MSATGDSWGSVLRILFVGDEASLPSELSDYVADLGDQWQVQQVADGNSAIEAAALSPFDAVIVAPVLPDLTSATLLGQIRTLRPDTIRIALIDAQDGQRTPPARIIGVAHRFLPMPLAPEVLLEAITSLEELRDLLGNPRLRAAIGRIEKLPSPPHLYLSLMHALEEDEGADAADIAKLIAGDPAIAAKVLQLCNSAFFSGGRSITDLRTAVTRLGVATLRDLVLASEVFSVQTLTPAERNAMQRRALLSSRLAAKVLPPTSAELGSTAALLADIGLLLPGVRDEREPPLEGGDDRLGHTEAGAYLLGLWGLPMPIIEAVAFHRHPQRSSLRSFWVTGAVHVATALASGETVDEEYLSKVGVLTRLPTWREQADTLLGLAEA
ncbi:MULTISPECIES: HDOD domain-containing protein [Xanthomonas]|uniref:HDOD domain-containing protein n=2 Tax=Xanthomonas arboricola pv. pruni TaxID=69929 RepID=A0AAP4NJI4_9XANT|nr:HDOD domain-containing protein [Xanthomonas arboricola]AKU50857.1 chemotaxis protein CheY [Xanthomonas arboricola pv. juglandis]KCX00961.1 chemotaxis protein CheY [Xanthomonas arboricola pv. pruni]KER87463.1 chemotaxis protein CheY [Xanthomonas arboricola pv. celebensis]KOB22580.1 chemotaxis protein CheY [Xanthomonas arboricola]KOB46793.1 chemotaxis protein CheY [Xanthomonas arboricola]